MHRLKYPDKLYYCRQIRLKQIRQRKAASATQRAKLRLRRGQPHLSIRLKPITLVIPRVVQISEAEPRKTILALIERARRAISAGQRVKFDFRDAEELHPCGTLVLLAHIITWAEVHPEQVTGTYPKDDVVEQLLQHFKILDKFGLPNRTTVNHDRVRFWHFKSGRTVDAASYKDLAVTVRDNIEHPHRELFADCLNEAVSNAVGHAYDFRAPWMPPESHRKWWVVSSLRDNHVFVAIYDMGVTIPSSLRKKPELSDFLKFRRYKDARLIEAATSSERTSTRLPHRGKGLPEMLEFSKNLASGFLSIASGRGAYNYYASSGKATKRHLECQIPGTLVLWQIPFQSHSDEQNNDLNC